MPWHWKVENTVFDSLHEADVWADSIGYGVFMNQIKVFSF